MPAAGLLRAPLPLPAALYLLCLVIPVWFNLGPLTLSTLRVFLLVMIIPVMLRLLAGVYGRVMAVDILFILHVMWTVVALAVNNPAQVVAQTGSVGLEFLGGYALGRAYIRTPGAFLAMIRWLIVIVFCLVPFAVIETLTYRVPIIEAVRALPGITSVELIRYEPRMGLYRAQVAFAHPIHFGLFCSVAFSLAFVARKGLVSAPRRWFAALVIGAAGFLALSSGAFLAILLQIGLILWAVVFDRLRWRWWLLAGLILLAWMVIELLSNRSAMRVFMTYATFSAHTAYFRAAIFEWGMVNLWRSPVFGIGLNDWERPFWMFSSSVDNFWLLMAMRYGILGFLLVAAGYAWGVVRVMSRDFSADPVLANIRKAWVFTFMGLTFTLFTVHVWTSIYSFTFFLFGAGMWLITARPSESRPPDAGPSEAGPSEPGQRPPSDAARGGAAAPPRGPRYSRFAPRTRGPL